MNRSASTDLLENASFILEERIKSKIKKCSTLPRGNPIWLALLNDYFLTDTDTYKLAFECLTLPHQFAKILLVSSDKSVEVLFE